MSSSREILLPFATPVLGTGEWRARHRVKDEGNDDRAMNAQHSRRRSSGEPRFYRRGCFFPANCLFWRGCAVSQQISLWGSRRYIRRRVLGSGALSLPTLSHPRSPSQPFLHEFHLHVPRETRPLCRSYYPRRLLPRYAEPTRHTPNSLSNLLYLLSPISSVPIHPKLVAILSDPTATCWTVRYSSTSSSCDIVQQ